MSTGHYTNGESRGTFLGMARTKKPRPQVETTAGVKRSRRLSSNLDALSQVYHRNAESQPAARATASPAWAKTGNPENQWLSRVFRLPFSVALTMMWHC